MRARGFTSAGTIRLLLAVREFSMDEREVLVDRLLVGATLTAIARRMSLSTSQVARLERQALKRLRRQYQEVKLAA